MSSPSAPTRRTTSSSAIENPPVATGASRGGCHLPHSTTSNQKDKSSFPSLILSPQSDEFQNACWRRIEAQRKALDTGCIEGLKQDMTAIQNVLNDLVTVQQNSISSGRFHVLYEVESSVRQSSSSLELFVLFSPTIDPHKEEGNYTLNALSHYISMNTVLKRWTDSRGIPRSLTKNLVPSPNNGLEHRHSDRSYKEPRQLSSPDTASLGANNDSVVPDVNRDNHIRVTSLHIPSSTSVVFPNWFPTAPQDIKLASADMFYRQDSTIAVTIHPCNYDFFEPHLEWIPWLYRTFFNMLQCEARNVLTLPKRQLLGSNLRYGSFTPPWLKMKLMCGKHVAHIASRENDRIQLPDLHNAHSIHGRIRLLMVLAAFKQFEVGLASDLLDYIMDNKEQLKEVTNTFWKESKTTISKRKKSMASKQHFNKSETDKDETDDDDTLAKFKDNHTSNGNAQNSEQRRKQSKNVRAAEEPSSRQSPRKLKRLRRL